MTAPYRFRIDTADGPAFVEIQSEDWHSGGPVAVFPADPDDPTDVLPALNVEHFLSCAVGYRGHVVDPERPRPQDLYFALECNRFASHPNPDILGFSVVSGDVPDEPGEDPNGERGVNTEYGRERGTVD